MLKFKLIEKKDMSKDAGDGAKLFYPQLVSNGRVSFDSLCDEVAEQSSLTSGDIKNCMDRLINCLVRHLQEGRSVDCGDLGSLTASCDTCRRGEAWIAATSARSALPCAPPGHKVRRPTMYRP